MSRHQRRHGRLGVAYLCSRAPSRLRAWPRPVLSAVPSGACRKLSGVYVSVRFMALVVMMRDVDTGETLGRVGHDDGRGWSVTEVLRLEDFEGLNRVSPRAGWLKWNGRRVRVTTAHTESSPSGIWWMGTCLEGRLADDLFGSQLSDLDTVSDASSETER